MVYVGVIKVLEEYCVLIYCIVGISMGVLVGVSYVIGMSVVEMEKINGEIIIEFLFKEKLLC